jgi:23S rRNA-/tRNA-specific pseudouridylate synthase
LGTQSTLCEYSEYPAQVHRLDEGTSGLMLVARTDAVRSVALETPRVP